MGLGAELILAGRLTRRGLITPLEVPYDLLVSGLARRDIRITCETSEWPLSRGATP